MPSIDLDAVRPLLLDALAEDTGPGDATSALLVPDNARARARLIAKADGVLAGLPAFFETFRLAVPDLEIERFEEEGKRLARGAEIAVFEGGARGLLRAERPALNLLMRLSGIATLTARFVAAVAGTRAEILDTRKTTPGLRALEKYAVAAGGGRNHRFGLYDAVLVKENHLAFGRELGGALSNRPGGMVAIVEAESREEALAAAAAGADVVLLDEFAPEEVAAVRAALPGPKPLLEVSGGVTLATVRAYAEAGADRISVGALTHSAPALDLSLRLSPISG